MGGSWVTTHQLILSRGVWLINFGCAFETNATGDRMVVLNNSTTQTVGQNNDIIVKSAASSYTIINGTRVVNVDSASNEVWYLHIGHNATSYSLYVNPYIRAVKLL